MLLYIRYCDKRKFDDLSSMEEVMNDEQLKLAISRFEDLKHGLTNEEVKDLGLRPFCQRIQRRVRGTKRVLSLYALTPEWEAYVQRQIIPERTSEIHDLLQEFSIPNSCSSLMSENRIEPIGRKATLSDKVYESVAYGDCRLESIFDRVMLLQCYYEKLCNEGMPSISIIQHDLYGMIKDYIVKMKNGRYRLKDNVQIHIQNIIYQNYKRDINEYLNFVKEIWEKNRYPTVVGVEHPHVIKHISDALSHVYSIAIQKIDSIKDPSDDTIEAIENFLEQYPRKNNEFYHKMYRGEINHSIFLENTEKLFRELMKECSASDEPFDVRNEWNKYLSARRDEIICNLIKKSYENASEYSRRIGHPFMIELNIIACLYYIIIHEDEAGRYEIPISDKVIQTIPSDTVFQLIPEINNDDLSRIISLYLMKSQRESTNRRL